MSIPDDIVQDWLNARKVIADFLRELRPDMTQEHCDHNAAAIIARLSHAGMTVERLAK